MSFVLCCLLLLAPEGSGAGEVSALQEASADSLLAEVREEYALGRYWHGVRILREALAQGREMRESLRLLLAEGEAGWGDWEAVRALLEEPLTEGALSGAGSWYLLGRSLEATEDWQGAEEAYASALEAMGPGAEVVPGYVPDDEVVRSRRVRALARSGQYQEAEEALGHLPEGAPSLASWLGLEVAGIAAAQGVTEATRIFLSAVPQEEVRREGWDLPARALLAAGDSAGAEAVFWGALPSLSSPGARGEAWARVGRLRLARGDSAGARGAYHQVLGEGTRGALAVEAASALMTLGIDSVGVARRSAEVLAGAGRGEDALGAWNRYEVLLGQELPPDVKVALARLHLRLRAPGTALETLASLPDSLDEGMGVSVLNLEIQALGALGRRGEARSLQDTLVARFPHRAEAVEILFLRADALQDRGDWSGALAGFQATIELAPTQNLAGQARMRMGQIHLARGRLEEAAGVFQAYLADFPNGRRWDEAAFWAGRTLRESGREEEARQVLENLRRRFPLSYYTVQAGLLLDVPYGPELTRPSDSLPLTPELAQGLARVDDLLAGGFQAGADWEVARLVARAREEGPGEGDEGGVAAASRTTRMLALARALNQRGFTREGINLGWAVQGMGREWDGDLLMTIYPFPYRELVVRTAREGGLDPFLMAGLMRQESAFWARAVSRADARGLMQVLPSTGAELARARGPQPFDADEHLFRPEINVHLGMAFFSDMQRRFGDDLSIILSAYNAGPTRARRWREYPEAGDLPRFVERIPFTETRGYVKNVLRNREIYAWLYGEARARSGS